MSRSITKTWCWTGNSNSNRPPRALLWQVLYCTGSCGQLVITSFVGPEMRGTTPKRPRKESPVVPTVKRPPPRQLDTHKQVQVAWPITLASDRAHSASFPRTPVLPDYRTPGLPDYRTTGLLDYRTIGLPDYRTTGLPDYRTTGLPDYLFSRAQRSTKMPVKKDEGYWYWHLEPGTIQHEALSHNFNEIALALGMAE